MNLITVFISEPSDSWRVASSFKITFYLFEHGQRSLRAMFLVDSLFAQPVANTGIESCPGGW